MSIASMAADDPELSEEVVEEVRDAEDGAGEDKGEEPRETIRLSRYKRKEREREEREQALKAEAEARRAETERLRTELQQTREMTAQLRGAVEQMQRQPRETQQQRQEPDVDPRDKLDELRRQRAAALGKSDLEEYERIGETITDLRAEMKARAILAAQQRSMPAPQPQQVQKPDWVRAVEFQYADILSHPRGQHTVGILDSLSTEPWGPERLHKAFQRARQELGLKAPAASQQSSRGLYTSIESTGTGPARSGGRNETSVSIPKKNLEEMMRAGLTRAQAAKAWRESYPDE